MKQIRMLLLCVHARCALCGVLSVLDAGEAGPPVFCFNMMSRYQPDSPRWVAPARCQRPGPRCHWQRRLARRETPASAGWFSPMRRRATCHLPPPWVGSSPGVRQASLRRACACASGQAGVGGLHGRTEVRCCYKSIRLGTVGRLAGCPRRDLTFSSPASGPERSSSAAGACTESYVEPTSGVKLTFSSVLSVASSPPAQRVRRTNGRFTRTDNRFKHTNNRSKGTKNRVDSTDIRLKGTTNGLSNGSHLRPAQTICERKIHVALGLRFELT
jgi:hypothetical protein